MTSSELELLETLEREHRQAGGPVSISAMVAASGAQTRGEGVEVAECLLGLEVEGYVLFRDGGLVPTMSGLEALHMAFEFDEPRIDAIGQNGNDGLAYGVRGIGASTTACDDQLAADPESSARQGAIESLALIMEPEDWRQSGSMRFSGHTVTWGEYVAERQRVGLSCQGSLDSSGVAQEKERPRVRLADEPAGRKDDGGKLRMDLLFKDMPLALTEVVDVLTQGANKYAPGNWQRVPDPERRYLAAGLRHELALARGQSRDDETQCHHLAHTICCDLFRLELALRSEQ